MGTKRDQPVDVLQLDQMVLLDVNVPGWHAAVDAYLTNKHTLLGPVYQPQLHIENYLLYVRAFSRVLVDHAVLNHNSNTINPYVHPLAVGSTSITSDYDVTLVGKGSHQLAMYINRQFSVALRGKRLQDVADTNLYTAPLMLLHTAASVLTNNARNLLPVGIDSPVEPSSAEAKASSSSCSSRSMPWRVYIPLPTAANGGHKVAWLSALSAGSGPEASQHAGGTQEGKTQEEVETKSFNTLGAQFEEVMYQSTIDWKRAWTVIHAYLRQANDTYQSIATVCVVVVEMQMHQEQDQKFHACIHSASAIENLGRCQAYYARTQVTTRSPSSTASSPASLASQHEPATASIGSSTTDLALIKMSKYLYRVLHSVHRRKLDLSVCSAEFMSDVRHVMQRRADDTVFTSTSFQSYKAGVDACMERLQKWKVSQLRRYCH